MYHLEHTSTGYMCRPLRINSKGSNVTWVLEKNITHITYVINIKKETYFTILEKWMFVTHDKRKVYTPKS